MVSGFSFEAISPPTLVLMTNIVLLQPDVFEWWDPAQPVAPDPNDPMAHAYPRYSKHALAQVLRLGLAVRALARRAAPAAGAIVVVTNANDHSVDNAVTAQVVAEWRAHGAGRVTTYEFPAELNLEHDVIDPAKPTQHVDLVYPKLIELITP
jgi:carboxylesterase